MQTDWKRSYSLARLYERLPDNRVQCHLSPRHCTLREGQHGFCGVRQNLDGKLVTLNYGKSVQATLETIETEAVYHFAPGERILSMGNIGCMLNCAYCHNWKTSQAKFVSDRDVKTYSPEQVVRIAKQHGVRCVSWTYNDPVVWHEFVLDTAAALKEAGILNLYKSAFYISAEAVDELLPLIDIFSISIKSMDDSYYRKLTGGRLGPVLDATKQVFASGRHLEISNLMITDISDNESSARSVAEWAANSLSPSVPLHFVRFHPDYRMRNTQRTPIERLERARDIAYETGMRHVYIGNVYGTSSANTYCYSCRALLIERYGLSTRVKELTSSADCANCGQPSGVRLLPTVALESHTNASLTSIPPCSLSVRWRGDIKAAHIVATNTSEVIQELWYRHQYSEGTVPRCWQKLSICANDSIRFMVAQEAAMDLGVEIAVPSCILVATHEVFDRAHFPTFSVEEAGASPSDVSPLHIIAEKCNQ